MPRRLITRYQIEQTEGMSAGQTRQLGGPMPDSQVNVWQRHRTVVPTPPRIDRGTARLNPAFDEFVAALAPRWHSQSRKAVVMMSAHRVIANVHRHRYGYEGSGTLSGITAVVSTIDEQTRASRRLSGVRCWELLWRCIGAAAR
jgi:hypothetical protein